jgi:hypothetical protein
VMQSPKRLLLPFLRTVPAISLSRSPRPCPFQDCTWNWKSILQWARCRAMSHWGAYSCIRLINPGLDLLHGNHAWATASRSASPEGRNPVENGTGN